MPDIPYEKSPRAKKPHADRAKQFMPFAALKGYYDLIEQRKRKPQPRHELTEEEQVRLSAKLSQVRHRTMCSVTFYDVDAYVTVTGMVAQNDMTFRRLTIVKRCIPYDDILDVSGEGIVDPWGED